MGRKDELLDIYDGSLKHIGTKVRDLVHRDGDWHKTLHCWIAYKSDDGANNIVLQQRSPESTWPNYLDITAAGHYKAGERLEDALREIEEEIGITVAERDLLHLGRRVCVEDFLPGVLNHEFQDVFLLIDSRPLRFYRLQGDELAGIFSVNLDELVELFREEVSEIGASGIIVGSGNSDRQCVRSALTRASFIPSLDRYIYKMAVLALRALRGEKDLLI